MRKRMMTPWKWVTASVTMLAIVTVFAGGYVLGTHAPRDSVEAQASQPPDTEELFAPFWETWTLLHDNYVDPLDDTQLMEEALRGMIESLGDPNTDYMDPETFARVNESMSGEYEGIGAAVRKNEETGGLELVSIFDESPAEQAGLQPGDQIIEVDGEDVTDLPQEAIIALVRGPAGTAVTLGILRQSEPELLSFDVVRGRIAISTVTSRVLEGDIGYVRLSQFDFETGTLMREALKEMDVESLNGLILDVRGDPGGYLTTAIDVASAFMDEGAVVIERKPDSEFTHMVRGDAIATEVPMVVLVDEGSASASELIAGALQDQGRATIVGMTTFGKGSVQTWRELSNGGGVRITISRWYTPEGRSVSDVGIAPDIEVPLDLNAAAEGVDNQLEAAIAILNGTYDLPAVLEKESVSPALP